MIHIIQQRTKYRKDRTPGEVLISGERVCFSLEDELRELPGVPVQQWKQKERTSIPAGAYLVELVDSTRFGKETLGLKNVPGFSRIRIHGGNDEQDTEGCPLMGAELDAEDRIPEGKSKAGLAAIRARLLAALRAGDEVVWEIRNPPGYAGPEAAPAAEPAKAPAAASLPQRKPSRNA